MEITIISEDAIRLVKQVLLSETDNMYTNEDCEHIIEEAQRGWKAKGLK